MGQIHVNKFGYCINAPGSLNNTVASGHLILDPRLKRSFGNVPHVRIRGDLRLCGISQAGKEPSQVPMDDRATRPQAFREIVDIVYRSIRTVPAPTISDNHRSSNSSEPYQSCSIWNYQGLIMYQKRRMYE